jgi:hypothetical protein
LAWAGSGQQKRKGRGRGSSWAEAAARPPALLDQAEREGERVKKFSPFLFSKK